MPISPTDIRNWTIYRITSPVGKIYIGLTSNLDKRMSCYRSNFTTRQTLIFNSIKKYGFPSHELRVIDTFTSNVKYANGKEMFWIKTYMSNRNRYPEQKGLNLNDGGGTGIGFKPTPEMNEKNRQAKLGKKQSAEVIERRTAKLRGRKMNFTHLTPEYRKMISERNKGYKHTPESLKKISEASKISNKGKVLSEATKEKLRQANLGKKLSDDTKAKISKAGKGKKIKNIWTLEMRQKMREIKLASGFKHTDEAKRKISEAGGGNKYMLGRKQTESQKKKMSEIHTGNKYNLGIKQSPEQIEKRISKIRGLKRVKVGDMFISYKKHTFQRRVFNLTA